MNWAKKQVNAKGRNKIRVMAVRPVPVATSAVGQEETLAAEAEEILAAEVAVATSAAEGTPVEVEAAEGTPVEVEAAAISKSEGSQNTGSCSHQLKGFTKRLQPPHHPKGGAKPQYISSPCHPERIARSLSA